MSMFDDIDHIFKRYEELMDKNFSGGYMTNRDFSDNGIDIFEDDDHIYITLEIKVFDDDLEVIPLEDHLEIEAMLDGRWRGFNINLPSKVDPKTAKISFRNNVLDVELEKINEQAKDNNNRN